MGPSSATAVAAPRALVVGAAALLPLLWLAAPSAQPAHLEGFLPLHSFIEAVTIILAAMVFGVTWNAHVLERPGNLALLGSAMLAAALIDFGHALSYAGMPDFITPASEEKAIYFWLPARLLAAAGLLAMALPPWAALRGTRTRYGLLAGAAALVLLVYWLVLARPLALPAMFTAESGLTPAKVAAELAIGAVYAAAGWALYARARRTGDRTDGLLSVAAAFSVLSEACLSFYATATDLMLLAGHAYKVAAYGFLYYAVHVACIRAPFDAARERARALASAERIAHVGSWEADFRSNRLHCSDELLRILGVAREAFDGTIAAAVALAHPGDRQRLTEAIDATLHQGKPFDIEYRVLRPDGSVRLVRAQDEVVRDARGVALRAFGITEDITERKLAEQALRESEDRFRTLTELSSDFYWEQDENFRFVERIGAAWEQRTYGSGHTLGKRRWDLPALNLTPEDWARHRADLEAHREFRNLEIERPLGNGRTRWISTSGRPIFDAAGRFIGYRGIGQDITERKRTEQALRQSEAQLRLIADNIPVMIAYIDTGGRYLYVNRRYAEFLGLDAAAFAGQPVAGRVGEAVWERFRPAFEKALAGRASSFEGRFRRADGSVRDVTVEVMPHRNSDGTAAGVFAVSIDVTRRHRAERQLREREEQLNLVVDNVPAMLCYFDSSYRYRYANRQYVDYYAGGQPLEGRTLREGLGEAVWSEVRSGIDRALAGETVTYTRTDRREGASPRTLEVTMLPHRDAGGRVAGVHTMIIDISDRLRAEQDLRLRDRAIESSVNSIMITQLGPEGQRIVYVNPAFERMTGYAEHEVLGRSPRFLFGADRDQEGVDALRSALREQREALVLLRNYRKDGSQFWNELRLAPVRDDAGRATHYISVANDVSDRIRYQQEIERNANYDSLTGLPNRNLLNDRLAQAVTRAARAENSLAVLFVDVDHLKRINDSLGHSMGDRVIAAVAQRIAQALRGEDTVARHGGDEFVIVLPHLSRAEDAQRVAAKVFASIAAPLRIDAHEFVLTASAGIAMHPRDGADAETLLRNADAALYRAKDDGRNCFRFFTPEMNDRVVQFLATERSLRAAIDGEQFALHYQPIVDLASGATVGAEALIRWRRGDGSLVAPAEFVPIAEESGLIVPIGQWVVQAAARQAAAWNRPGAAPLYVSVNLSARQFRDAGLLDGIRAALAAARVAPPLLRFEITESTVMQEPERAAVMLGALKELGVTLSVDDFGTGYSSLAYLKRFPIDVLKIDRSFVRDLPRDTEDLALCRAIISLAQALELEVVAEGIETDEQARSLSTSGCRFGQGYHFGRPVDPAAFRAA